MADSAFHHDVLRRRAFFLGCLAAAYGAVYVALAGMRGGITKDEVYFWPLVEEFSAMGWPSLEQLSDYRGLTTPLSLLVFGWLERATGGGLHSARLLNLAISFAIVTVVGMPSRDRRWTGPLCAIGLLAFPYFLGTSVLVYTDIMTAAFGLAGVAAYLKGRHGLSAGAFVLAIACRQYMVAFPAAVLAWELAQPDRRARPAAITAQVLATGSILAWIALFGGLAPREGLRVWQPGTAGIFDVRPQHALYFLACIGAYFVIVEAILLRPGWWHDRPRLKRVLPSALLVLAPLFVVFPPLDNPQGALTTMGFLDRGVHLIMGDTPRIALYCGLAAIACIRFSHRSLAFALLIASALITIKGHIAWDKYALPLLVVLWYLAARETRSTALGAPAEAAVPATV